MPSLEDEINREFNVPTFLFSGEVQGPKLLKIRMKRMWYEHVKRRPAIDALAENQRLQHWLNFKKLSNDPMLSQPLYLLKPPYSPEEKRIIATPIEKLMEDYIKTLQ